MATATIATSSPAVNHKFAVRTHIKVLAVVCECGAVHDGRGVRKMKMCPRCGALVISANDKRYRDRHPWRDVDQKIHDRYSAMQPGEVRP